MNFPHSFLLIILSLTQLNGQWVKLSDVLEGRVSPVVPQPNPARFVNINNQQIELSNARANPLSVGGDFIRKGDAPWLCPIFHENGVGKLEYLCGSSLISTKFVLTAAHCVQEKGRTRPFLAPDVIVICGVYSLANLDDPNAQRSPGKTIKVHPNWNTTTRRFDGDIALIELLKPIQRSRYIEGIALPPSELVRPGTEGFVVGYGESERESMHEKKARKIQIPIVGMEECYQNHEAISVIKSKDAFCAGRIGVVPCNGDSGSSYYLNYRSTYTIVGVVSIGIKDDNKRCNNKTYAIFADVAKHVDWIKETVGSGFEIAGSDGQTEDEEELWRPNETFCEYIEDAGYRCTLRNVRSTTSDVRITRINGEHLDGKSDGDVEKLWIIEQRATYIPEMSPVVRRFPRIKDLRIWNCGLKHIEKSKISIFKRVRVLDFFQNHIEWIPSDAFDDMPQLEELKVLNNRIKELPENLFKNLKNLAYFFAEYNEIEELPKHLFDGTKIAVVNLKGNRLKRIGVDFTTLPNINNVDLDGNDCINKCMGRHNCGKMSVNELQGEIEAKCSGEETM